MGHQVADRHRPIWVDEAAVAREHLHAREGREVLRHRVDEGEPSLLDEGHQCRADDRLRHGVEAKDRVGRHRRASLPVAPAVGAGVHHGAAPHHHRGDARVDAAVDVALHEGVDPAEALRIDADSPRISDLDRHGFFPLPPSPSAGSGGAFLVDARFACLQSEPELWSRQPSHCRVDPASSTAPTRRSGASHWTKRGAVARRGGTARTCAVQQGPATANISRCKMWAGMRIATNGRNRKASQDNDLEGK